MFFSKSENNRETANPDPLESNPKKLQMRIQDPVYKSEANSPDDPGNDGKPRKKKNIGLRSKDFNLKLGKVVDTLNSDYPLIFVKPLDYSIYIDEIEVTDPTGIAFQGKNTYKSLFTVLRFFAKTVFSG